ncbi:YciI family protein [Caulobacter sp. S45]|uniref:YciI family protein n=1 Tax=Caulobacter sp. S45 TaxID=1641861 RepID=UPI001576C96F|nr:YciI family protein [Caulobacter sp. S45]
MLFAVSGHFKEGGADAASHISFSAHIAQNVCRVHLGGPLYDAAGQHIGALLLVEAKSFSEAEAYLHSSPYAQAGLYDHITVSELRTEVGTI